MAEEYKNYHKTDVKLPFKLFNPDGSAVTGVDPESGAAQELVRKMTPEEVEGMRKMGYRVELVEDERAEAWQSYTDK